ncbi:hypothetical protein HC891_08055, partial [Candidatus Gracilibacteria bacterium]|nr:hypothetical protein [Candidatus Gracilibacteria bacterium]
AGVGPKDADHRAETHDARRSRVCTAKVRAPKRGGVEQVRTGYGLSKQISQVFGRKRHERL